MAEQNFKPVDRSLFEKLISLRDFQDESAPHLKERYILKFENLKLKNGITNEDIAEFEILKAQEEIKKKEELNKQAFFVNEVKFKNKEHFNEYLKSKGLKFTVWFLGTAILKRVGEKIKNKFKNWTFKTNLKPFLYSIALILFSIFETYVGLQLTTFKNLMVITILNTISFSLYRKVNYRKVKKQILKFKRSCKK